MLKFIGYTIAKSFNGIVFGPFMNCIHEINIVHAVIGINAIYAHTQLTRVHDTSLHTDTIQCTATLTYARIAVFAHIHISQHT